MKKILLTLLFIGIAINGYSQEYFKFMGIPIDGTPQNFIKKLEAKDFELVNENEPNILKGVFAGEKVRVAIYDSPVSKTVYSTIVVLYKRPDWSSTKLQFDKIIKQYTQKYGNSTVDLREFSDPYKEGDGRELAAITAGKVRYISTWNFEDGSIVIMIFPSGEISISYTDKRNEELASSEQAQVMQADI